MRDRLVLEEPSRASHVHVHDWLGHTVNVMVMQAGVGRHVFDEQPEFTAPGARAGRARGASGCRGAGCGAEGAASDGRRAASRPQSREPCRHRCLVRSETAEALSTIYVLLSHKASMPARFAGSGAARRSPSIGRSTLSTASAARAGLAPRARPARAPGEAGLGLLVEDVTADAGLHHHHVHRVPERVVQLTARRARSSSTRRARMASCSRASSSAADELGSASRGDSAGVAQQPASAVVTAIPTNALTSIGPRSAIV